MAMNSPENNRERLPKNLDAKEANIENHLAMREATLDALSAVDDLVNTLSEKYSGKYNAFDRLLKFYHKDLVANLKNSPQDKFGNIALEGLQNIKAFDKIFEKLNTAGAAETEELFGINLNRIKAERVIEEAYIEGKGGNMEEMALIALYALTRAAGTPSQRPLERTSLTILDTTSLPQIVAYYNSIQ